MTNEEAKKILRQNNVICTPKRLALLRVLSARAKPISAADLLPKVQVEVEIDLVTLYRNLTLLTQKEIVKELHLQKGISLYEYNNGNHHHHITCKTCGYMEDTFECLPKSVIEKTLTKTKRFSSVSEHHFELFGICTVCSK